MSEPQKRYRAFISYSQKDKAHARRLHQALERYRLPKGVEAAGVDIKTRRLGRFFRDDEEMGAATDLGAALQGAIADAENLIVVCSPNAAQSKWVNEEIIHFKRTGRADNIFAIIVGGTPNSEDEHECFPPALRFALGPDGRLSGERVEPLAVDLRKERFARVLTRLAAGIAQTPFDSLWRREQRRAIAQTLTLALAVFFIVVVVGGALTQRVWYPGVDAYWRYARHAHSAEELVAREPGTTFQDCREGSSDCPVMVILPEGAFVMGSATHQQTGVDEQGRPQFAPDERRRVSIHAFAVSRTEITFVDWEACVNAGGCTLVANRSDPGWEEARPVINVSLEDARNYVRWLSQMTGHDYRLLTEAEWEYAARGVASLDDPRNGESWSFGNDENQLGAYAWFGGNSDNESHPVATKRANPFGLYDMHGNVWEWVDDCFLTIASDPTCGVHVIRGGSWMVNSYSLRSDFRSGNSPSARQHDLGFRVARTLSVANPPPPQEAHRAPAPTAPTSDEIEADDACRAAGGAWLIDDGVCSVDAGRAAAGH